MLLLNHDDKDVQSTTFNAVKFVSKTMQMTKSKNKKEEEENFNQTPEKFLHIFQDVIKNSLSPDKVTLSLILC